MIGFRRLVRRSGGGVRVTLPPIERTLLLDVAETLRAVIADVGPDSRPDAITGRLFPRAYEDPLEEMEYADAMMPQLVEGKRTMLDTFAETLGAGRSEGSAGDRRWRADLDPDQVAAWIAVLQDARLVLSRVVGVETEEDWAAVESRDDDTAIVLGYLGDLLNGLVVLVMGGWDPGPAGSS